MENKIKYLGLCFVTSIVFALPFNATSNDAFNTSNWNQFRGPNGDGVSTSSNLPTEFSGTKNVQWRTAVHGLGWSSPVVWKDQVWVTTAREDGSELFVLCVKLDTGKIIHDIKKIKVSFFRV